MKHCLVFAWSALLAIVSPVTAAEPAYNYAQFLRQSTLQIPNSYTPFGNRMEFSRFGDDGSRCVADANGVLTWIDSQGMVRLLPSTELAVPLFVTNTECLVWNNRFADFSSYPNRPKAEIKFFRATPGSTTVTSTAVNTEGVEVAPTSPITTTTGTLNFVTLTRKDNGEEVGGGSTLRNLYDACDVRIYRMSFSGTVQLVTTIPSIYIKGGKKYSTDTISGPLHEMLGYGSDGSMVLHIMDFQAMDEFGIPVGGYVDQYYWINNNGAYRELPKVTERDAFGTVTNYRRARVDSCIFTSNTRMVYQGTNATSDDTLALDTRIWDVRRSASTGNIISTTEIPGVTGTAMEASSYTKAGSNRYFFTLDALDPTLVRTYKLLDNGVDTAYTRSHTLPYPVTSATVIGTVSSKDGSALMYGEDGQATLWLHSDDGGVINDVNNVSELPNSGLALPYYVTDEQCVVWENARAPLNGDGSIPPASVIHTMRDATTNALTPSNIYLQGNTLLNVTPYSPDFPYWLLTTAEKTQPDTSILRTYQLTSNLTTDRDNDGLIDAYETNTGTYVSPTDTGSDPSDPDTDGDGRTDGEEVWPFVMVQGTYTWPQAKTDAESRGGYLATIVSALENSALQNIIGTQTFFPMWLGGTDSVVEGSWEWVTGETFAYSNWTPGQPDNLQDSDGMVLQTNFKWSDAAVAETRGYLMELPTSDPNKIDTDGDGLTDGEEIAFKSDPNVIDTDGDGLNDFEEKQAGTNPLLADTDTDGLSDFDEVRATFGYYTDPLLIDTDMDGLEDLREYEFGTNPLIVDTDNDGLSDGEEVYRSPPTNPLAPDTDEDGLLDGDEEARGTDPLIKDTDGDGISDYDEVQKGTDPLDPNDPAGLDSDNDGLSDYDELFVYGTNPDNPDTDGDNLNDFEEIQRGTDPLVADSDGDGLDDGSEVIFGSDPLVSDTDGDGLTDKEEFDLGTSPVDVDTDGDGLTDFQEVRGYNGFFSDPVAVDTDGDGFSDYEEVTANPPTDPSNYNSHPPGQPPSPGTVLHKIPEPTGTADISIDMTYGPFGHRPETDKTSEDGSVALRDLNGVIVWVDNLGKSSVLPNSALGKTLYVSNSECVIWTNRFAADYNARGSQSTVVIYRRDAQGTLVMSDPITIDGTLLETSAISPATYGFTLIGCEARVSVPVNESRQRYESGSNEQGPTYAVRDVDVWDERDMTAYRITFDAQVQVLARYYTYIPRNSGNVTGVRLVGTGADGSALFSMVTARDFYDDVDDDDPGLFKSQIEGFWATWLPGVEQIVSLSEGGLSPVFDPLAEAIYVSNNRIIVETEEIDFFTEFPTGNYLIQDIRQRDNGLIEIGITSPLPELESVVPLSPVTRPGMIPYFYTVDDTSLKLSLYRVDATILKLGSSVTLPNEISAGSGFVRNPRDASLLVKTDGASGLVWIPSALDANNNVIGLRQPIPLPLSTLARPLFVTATEAAAWMNAGAPPDVANGGVVPLASITHFAVRSNGALFSTSLAPPALGRYVASASPLVSDPDSEGWFISTFEKTAARSALLRTYRLRTDQTADSDGDGLLDIDELRLATDPSNTDSDGDGISDGREVYPFYIITGNFTYEQARQDAIRRGGWLAIPDTADRQTALRRLFGPLATGNKFWLGGGDIDGPTEAAGTREGQYRWIDEETGAYFDEEGVPINTPMILAGSPWSSGQPTNSGNADGLVLRPDYLWEMGPLANSYSYILEVHPSDPTKRDTDSDGLTDYEEVQLGTNSNRKDTDGDGVDDPMEIAGYSWDATKQKLILNEDTGSKSNPLVIDSDGDGLSDYDEVRFYGTNPLIADTDNDGLTDKEEVTGTSPTDPLQSDTDSDGFTDYDELTAVPPSDPNDPDSRPSPGQLVPPNPNMHDQVEFIRQQDDVAIPSSFSPFGNRSDYNRFGDDGSAMVLDVNGVLLWQDAQGTVRTVPNSEYAIPLVVSGNEAIVWTNAFDPARVLGDPNNPVKIAVAVYRVDPATGQIGTPTALQLEGTDMLPTAPITTTSEAYTLVTFNFGTGGSGSNAFIYRMTYAGNAQVISQIHIPNLDDRLTAVQKIHALGHGSDGSIVFSIDPYSAMNGNEPVDGILSAFPAKSHRRIFAVNGSLPGPSGVVAELSSGTRVANLGTGSLPPRALYTASTRVVYKTAEDAGTNDARRNPSTGALTSDNLMLLPANYGSFLQITTQTVLGDTRWLYATSADGLSINAYRLSSTGLEFVYSALIPNGYQIDSTAVVSKINPLDGSAILMPNNADMLWIFNNLRPTVNPNSVKIPNSQNARPIYVQRNELVLWGNARDGVNNMGALNNVEIRHYEQKDGTIVNPSNAFTNLSAKIAGRYVLDTLPFTPDYSQWFVTTVEKASPTLARFRTYRLNTYKSLDSDADSIPDNLEVQAGTNANIADTDGDGLSDGDELYPYDIVDGSFTWEEAKADAAARGGKLAVIANQDDYTAMKYRFKAVAAFDLWLGATDRVTEGNWLTVNGTALSLTNWKLPSTVLSWADYYSNTPQIRVPWATGKPDNFNNADGLVLRTDFAFEDRILTERRGYLIEYPRTDPLVANADKTQDTDADSLPDVMEEPAGTDPITADTDGDGLKDGDELYPYYVVDGYYTWEGAKADAAARGGRLAVIANQDDYTALKFRLKSSTALNIWLGATDQVTEATWLTVAGTPLKDPTWKQPSTVLSWADYYAGVTDIRVPWSVGKPDNMNNADGLMLRTDFAFEDRPITERRGYLLEYPRTNPLIADTDGDGANDSTEIDNGTNPQDPNSIPDAEPPRTEENKDTWVNNFVSDRGFQDIPFDYVWSPFGQRTDQTRWADDGSVVYADASGMLLWQTTGGIINAIPNSEKAIPLVVSNDKAIIWQNAFNNNNDSVPGDGNGADPIEIYIYSIDPSTGVISNPTVLTNGTSKRMLGSNVLATAPITSTTQAYHLITSAADGAPPYRIYRVTLSGDVQAVSTINEGQAGAREMARVYGHGSDGTSVFYTLDQARPPENRTQDVYWVDGARSSSSSGVWEELGDVSTEAGVLGSRTLYTSSTRVVYEWIVGDSPHQLPQDPSIHSRRDETITTVSYPAHGLEVGDRVDISQTLSKTITPAGAASVDINGSYVVIAATANTFTISSTTGQGSKEEYTNGFYTKIGGEQYRVIDARRNPFTGFSAEDDQANDNDITPGDADYFRFLQISTQTVAGDIRWAYALNLAQNQILVYRLNNLGFQLVYRAALPAGTTLDEWATVKKINPLDGSAIITSDNIDSIVWLRNAGQSENNAVLLPSSSQAEGMFVSKDQAVVWKNAKAPVSYGGVIPNVQIIHYRMPLDTLIPTNLSSSVRGKFVLSTPIFSPDEKYWEFKTLEKTGTLNTRIRRYSLSTLINRDADGDFLPDSIETQAGTNPVVGDVDGDQLLDGIELYPYYIVNGSFTQEEAKADAIARGGRLASITNRDDYTALVNRFKLLSFADLWLGADDQTAEGSWVWSTGVPLNNTSWIIPGLYNWSNFYDATSAVVPWTVGKPDNSSNADGLVMRADLAFEDRPTTERRGYLIEFPRTDAKKADTDGDGLTDYEEIYTYGSNPTLLDTDGDGLTDRDEVLVRKTNPKSADTDKDGINDALEINGYRWDVATSTFVSSLGGAHTNPLLRDSDGDGYLDSTEVKTGTDPNDRFSIPTSMPDASDLSLYNQIELVRRVDNISIPQSYSPFGNRTEYNRFGDDGSALLMDVNGMLLWKDAEGNVRPIPDSQYAVPLVVSNKECIVWNNCFDPVRMESPGTTPLSVSICRLDSLTGTVVVSAPLELIGNTILPTSPVTTSTQAYSLVTVSEDGSARVYRITFSGQVQQLTTIPLPALTKDQIAGPNVRVIGHGSDGSLAFSVISNYDQAFHGALPYEGLANWASVYWVNGSTAGPSAIWERIGATATDASMFVNVGTAVEPRYVSPFDYGSHPKVHYLSTRRALYQMPRIAINTQTSGNAGSSNANVIVDQHGEFLEAIRNISTGQLTSDSKYPDWQNRTFLQRATLTVEGSANWLYELRGSTVIVYRNTSGLPEEVYRATFANTTGIPTSSATVVKVNATDGSAVIQSDSGQMYWLANNGTNALHNVLPLPDTASARPMFVSGKELVVWGNANNAVNEQGGMNNPDLRYYSQVGGAITTDGGGYSQLGYRVSGRYIMDTPPFTPGAQYWLFGTVVMNSSTSMDICTYRMIPVGRLDSDSDGIPDILESRTKVANPSGSETSPMVADTDGDELEDGDELYPYYVVAGNFTWDEARADAIARGGDLAVVTNRDDYEALKKRLSTQAILGLWMGANDQTAEGSWLWTTGQALNTNEWAKPGYLNWSDFYTTSTGVPWAIGKPDNAGNADGLVLRSDLAFEDRLLTERRGYLIQYPRTDPNTADSDSDGVNDGDEVTNGTDPMHKDPFTGVPSITPGDNTLDDSPSGFVPFSNKSVATSYEGLVYDPAQGYVFRQKISVTSKGGFSASVNGLTSSIKGSFKGSFNATGYYIGAAPNGLPNVVSIEMQMVQESPGHWIIIGRAVTSTGDALGIELRPAQYSKTAPYPVPGSLTMALPLTIAGTEGPRGDGVVTGKISSTGAVSLQMYLPDGGKASFSGPIVTGDLIPVYAISKSVNKSAVIGPVNCASTRSDRDYDGILRFYSASAPNGTQFPLGFDQARTVWGSRYVAPAKGFLPVSGIPATQYNTLYNMIGGDFGGISKVATWAVNNAITVPSSPTDSASIKFATSTGLITYKYTRTDAARLMIKAVASGYAVTLQRSADISGFYTSSFSTGLLTVTPNDGTVPEITMISPTSKQVYRDGLIYEVNVQTSGAWQVVPPVGVDWVAAEIISGGYVDPADPTAVPSTTVGSGPGIVRITVGPVLLSSSRSTQVEIAGIQHKINQDYRTE